MAYCLESDLLVKDTLLPPGETLQVWVDRAAEEMDSYLGYRYEIPIVPSPIFTVLYQHETLVLKMINAKLASGRYYLAASSNDEDDRLHAYGASLVREAIMELTSIRDGTVDLVSAAQVQSTGADESRKVPGVINHDSESLVLGWENTVMRGVDWFSRPGES